MSKSRVVLFPLVLLTASTDALLAFCDNPPSGFPIFHCSQAAYVEPVPAPYGPADVQAVFWQIGFGNDLLAASSPIPGDGTGISGKGLFSGNDSGTFPVDVLDAHALAPSIFPPGSVCLGSNNWANVLVDGCCDNPRVATFVLDGFTHTGDDNLLNPYFSAARFYYGYQGEYSLALQTDYPAAFLLTTPGEEYFAVAAVASLDRGNDGSGANGPCATVNPGSNPAPCDFRDGHYGFGDVSNGLPNVNDPGRHNVVPWQATPEPVVDATSPVDPSDPDAGFDVDLSWPALTFYHDGSTRPSTNPTLAPADPAAAPGVGVLDIAGRFGLVHSILQVAAVSDSGFNAPADTLECPGDPRCSSDQSATLFVPANHCVRLTTVFGVRPRSAIHGDSSCRIGRCGDIGYDVASGRVCFVTGCSPSAEACDGVDNDCDGDTDEDFGVGEACTGPGVCGAGVTECSGPASTRCSTEPGGSQDRSSPETCDDLDNDCDGSTDEGAAGLSGTATISPSTLNVNAQGNQFSMTLQLVDLCDPANPVPVDGTLVEDAWISRANATTLPDPSTISCPDPSGSFLFERGIVDDVPSRNFSGSGVTLRYSLAADGDCRTLDGDRQELLGLLTDALDGAAPQICVAGYAGGFPFEVCASATVLNRGNR